MQAICCAPHKFSIFFGVRDRIFCSVLNEAWRNRVEWVIPPRIPYYVFFRLTFVATYASLLLVPLRLQCRHFWHLTGTRKRRSEAIEGWVHFDRSVPAKRARARHIWRRRYAVGFRLNKLFGGKNPISLQAPWGGAKYSSFLHDSDDINFLLRSLMVSLHYISINLDLEYA